MRLQHHRLARRFALGATTAMITMMVALSFGATVGLAADYQDAKHNVCEGTFTPGSCEWGTHVTGELNVALGDAMMPALTSGSGDVALDTNALGNNTTGSLNVAIGPGTLFRNTEGFQNVASGFDALVFNTTGHDNIASGSDSTAFGGASSRVIRL